MALTANDVKGLLVSLLPQGSDQLYALRNSDNIGGLFYGISQALKAYAFDRLDALRLELNPSTCDEKIPDWEQACGLSNTPLAMFGTKAQRRNAILSVLRSHGSFSLDDIRAAVQPYLLYQDPTQIVILETPRNALRTAHTYIQTTPVTIGSSSTGISSVLVADDPQVSPAGAMLNVDITGILDEISLKITAPDGRQKVFPRGFLGSGAVVNQDYTLYAKELAGSAIRGDWTLSFTTGAGGGATLVFWTLFVEGLGVVFDLAHNRVGQGLGAAIYEFAVVADPALLGQGYDLVAANQTVQRVKPAHVIGSVVLMNESSGICAIPDDPATIPDACIPC